MSNLIRVLIVEDSEDDAQLILRQLRSGGYDPRWERVDTPEAMTSSLRREQWDVILCDYRMPRFSAPAALKLVQEREIDIPFIIVSGKIGEEMAVAAMKAGAHDYIMKDKLARLVVAVEREMREASIRHEKKKTEEALQRSEQSFKEISENAYDGIIVALKNGAYIYANRRVSEITGYAVNEILKNGVERFARPDESLKLSERRKKILAGENVPHQYETVIIHKNGNSVPIEITSAITQWYGQNADIFILRDITERKRAEEALRESEEQFREVVERANDFIIIIQDEQIQYANPQALEAFGYTLEEVIGTSLLNYVHPDEQEKLIDNYRRRLAGENVPYLYESALVLRNGQPVDVEISGGLISFKGRPANLVMVRDITERKASEQALRESEEKYRELVNNIAEVIYVCEPDGTILFISPAIEPVIGYHVSEIAGRNFAEFIYPDDLPNAIEKHNRVLTGESTVGEFRAITKSGQTRWLRASTRPEKRGSEVLNAYGVLMDITERKQAEQKLKSSEEQLRAMMESARDGIVMVNGQGNILVMNQAMTEMTGYSREEVLGREVIQFVVPQDRNEVQNDISYLTGDDNLLPLTSYRLITKDGRIIDVEVSNGLIRNVSSELVGMVCIIRDVTERKQWEKALCQSEERYRQLIENANEAILVAQEGMLKYVNPKACEITGYDHEEITFRPFLDFIYEEDREMVAEYHLKRLSGQPVPETYMFRVVDKQRSMRWLEISAVVIEWEGKPATLNFLSDVTGRKLAEDALRVSEYKYRFVTEQIRDMIAMTDSKGNYLYANEAYKKILGYNPTKMIGTKATEYLHPEDIPMVTEVLSSTPLQKDNVEVRFKHQDGSWRWCEARFSMMNVTLQDGTVESRILAVSNDITERKKLMEEKAMLLASIEDAYQNLQYAHDRLKASQAQLLHSEKLAAIGQLVAGVAHELNNPLMAVSGYATLLGLSPTEEETKEYVKGINEASARAIGIVDNLLLFARKQEHKNQLISINEIIENVIKLREYELRLDNVEVLKDLAAELPPVNADFQQLQQVFLNLIINSEQAINQSGDGGSIIFRTWQEGDGMVHAAVSDTGPGIPEDILSKIFEPFFTTKEVGEGTGLGLSICYGIIKEFGGTIRAINTSGNGAEFRIDLPAAMMSDEKT